MDDLSKMLGVTVAIVFAGLMVGLYVNNKSKVDVEGLSQYGVPRTEEERAERHEFFYPGEPLPPRGQRFRS